MNTPSNQVLIRLSDTELTIIDPEKDIRGRKVVDMAGHEVGHVDDLLIDDTGKHVRFMRVAAGGFMGIGGQKFLVPVDAIEGMDQEVVRINRTREHVAGGPAYDPGLAERPHLEQVYGYYELMPFWGVGYMYPAYPFYL